MTTKILLHFTAIKIMSYKNKIVSVDAIVCDITFIKYFCQRRFKVFLIYFILAAATKEKAIEPAVVLIRMINNWCVSASEVGFGLNPDLGVSAESNPVPASRMRLRPRRPLVCVRVNETRRSQTEKADSDERLLCAPSPRLKALGANEYASLLEATFNLGQT